MMDFNDVPIAARPPRDTEREEIRAALLAKLESVLFTLFPAGKKRHGKFLIGDILGSPGDSLEVVLDGEKAGLWTDRATGDGGDIFALIGGHYGIDPRHDFPRVLDQAAAIWSGARRPAPSAARRSRKRPSTTLARPPPSGTTSMPSGNLIAVVYRYDPPGGKKEFRPWDAKRRKMAPPDPRPLYNQPGMAAASQVVLVEGEKCAQALIDAGRRAPPPPCTAPTRRSTRPTGRRWPARRC